ncbi:MAG: RsmD family RNA methyltransferase [Phycisphaerae bacterium]
MRIIAGLYKGRVLLPPPPASVTRPITGQVKKSLFGMLGEDLTGQSVLDLYCGTGTLGIEALSRGAERCCFAENDRRVIQRLRRNIQDVGASARSTVWAGDVEHRLAGWLAELAWTADLAFVDPPYTDTRRWDWDRMGQTIFAPLAGRLAGDGIVVLRLPAEVEAPDGVGPLRVGRRREYGGMAVVLMTKQEKQ